MKSKSKFTVKIPSEIYKGEVFITAFFIVLNVMYTIFGNPPHFPMYILTILFVFIPIAISLLWIRKLKIVVSGSKITVRKILGFKYSVDVSEITKPAFSSISRVKSKISFPHNLRRAAGRLSVMGINLSPRPPHKTTAFIYVPPFIILDLMYYWKTYPLLFM